MSSVTEEKTRFERKSKWKNKKHKEARPQMKTLTEKHATEESSVLQSKVRYFNCSRFWYLAEDYKAFKREKSMCFKWHEKGSENGHVISECSSTIDSVQINYIDINLSNDNKFQRAIKASDSIGNYEVKIDTGSPINFVKSLLDCRFIPNCFVKQIENSNRLLLILRN